VKGWKVGGGSVSNARYSVTDYKGIGVQKRYCEV
jgi:hypothetical protein